MPPQYTRRDVVKVLQKVGFIFVSQKGSHMKFQIVINNKKYTTIVPNKKTIRYGTFRKILKQANLTEQKFIELLNL